MAAPPKKPHLRERYDERQRTVLDACARVYAERGYHGASIDDLLAATGLTRGGLYHYIGSKPESLARILGDLMGPLLEQAAAVVSGPDAPSTAEGRLRALVGVWLRRVGERQAHVRVFQQERHALESGGAWDEIRADRDAFTSLLVGVLRDGAASGELTIADPSLTALAIQGMVNHAATWLDPAGRLTPDEVADGFCDLVLDGMRA
ncbi:MAG: TetR/AcrR family transcriptional regulator [Solirubrobacteraceae bacterium]|nr:TetR/AcrR family transcriptional regulator [Solirubrobacteraceae bacterium]